MQYSTVFRLLLVWFIRLLDLKQYAEKLKITYLIFKSLRLKDTDLKITADNVSEKRIQTDTASLDDRSMSDEIQSELLFSLFPRSQTKSLNAYSTGITWPRIVWNKSLKNSFHSRYFSQPRGVCDRFLWSYSWLIDWFWFFSPEILHQKHSSVYCKFTGVLLRGAISETGGHR